MWLDTPEFRSVATGLLLLAALLVIVGAAFRLALALVTGGRDEDADDDPLPPPPVALRPPRASLDDSVRRAPDVSRVRDLRNNNGGLDYLTPTQKKGLTSPKRES